MAKKRMFSLEVIDTDDFLDMPLSSQALYFHLSMRADDDGFVSNPKKIMRMTGCRDDDMKVLLSKQYVISFDTGICVIRHWKINNYLRGDRYKETIYTDESTQLETNKNGSYSTGIPSGIPVVDTVKISIEENSKDKDSIDYTALLTQWNTTCKLAKILKLDGKRKTHLKARLSEHGIESFTKVIDLANKSNFLNGANDRKWKADFDWVCKPSNYIKILEGSYQGSGKPNPNDPNKGLESHNYTDDDYKRFQNNMEEI